MPYLLTLLLLVVLLFTACDAADEVVDTSDGGVQAVAFGAYVNRGTTRGGASGPINTTTIRGSDYGFGVYAYHTGTAPYNQMALPNFMYNQYVDYDAGVSQWTYTPKKYWPKDDTPYEDSRADLYHLVSFFAYAPNTSVNSLGKASDGSTTGIVSLSRPTDNGDVDGAECESDAFNRSFDSYQSPLPVLYQSGYLTIKCYDEEGDLYTLGFPNEEVRKGFAGSLYSYVTNTESDDQRRSALLKAYKVFRRTDDLAAFIEAVKTFYAAVPYQWEKDDKNEHYYHALLYTLLMAFGGDVRAEEPSAKGCSDITLKMPKGIYVMELKYDQTAEEALRQIDRKGYADKYPLDGRPVTKVGIAFSSKERNIIEWKSKLYEQEKALNSGDI